MYMLTATSKHRYRYSLRMYMFITYFGSLVKIKCMIGVCYFLVYILTVKWVGIHRLSKAKCEHNKLMLTD